MQNLQIPLKKAEKKEFKEAEVVLNTLKEELDESEFKDDSKFVPMIKDIDESIKDLHPVEYERKGSKKLVEKVNNNFNEQSNIENYVSYANNYQANYRNSRKKKKD